MLLGALAFRTLAALIVCQPGPVGEVTTKANPSIGCSRPRTVQIQGQYKSKSGLRAISGDVQFCEQPRPQTAMTMLMG